MSERCGPVIMRPTDAVLNHITRAYNSPFLVIKEYGPTSFSLKSRGNRRTFKVTIGNPHSCTCSEGMRTHQCIHVFFILLRVLNVDPASSLCWQHALIDREINIVLANRFRSIAASHPTRPARPTETTASSDSDNHRALEEDAICCICQDLMTPFDEIDFCSSCGNNVHANCITVWHAHSASHTCPLCRAPWTTHTVATDTHRYAMPTVHPGVMCGACHGPVDGPLYRCRQCSDLHLCVSCFVTGTNLPGAHRPNHTFQVKQRPFGHWKAVVPMKTGKAAPVDATQAQDMMTRDLTSDDYDLLCQLDDNVAKPGQYTLHPSWLQSKAFPVKVLTDVAMMGPASCAICADEFKIGDSRRMLPCQHIYHKGCIDKWLTKEKDVCPMCNGPVLAEQMRGTRYQEVEAVKKKAKPKPKPKPGPQLMGALVGVGITGAGPMIAQPTDRAPANRTTRPSSGASTRRVPQRPPRPRAPRPSSTQPLSSDELAGLTGVGGVGIVTPAWGQSSVSAPNRSQPASARRIRAPVHARGTSDGALTARPAHSPTLSIGSIPPMNEERRKKPSGSIWRGLPSQTVV
ncbi:E3 ubiquitin-protein ligase ZSWIM2 [Carpediemonas membranifera]|uniref:E3 ubiquitin-protein ligase ZSWIM2 n=1 Tax=Carpediemonas membranifera TaxID=201153 RepID=A0A8J6AYS8_9EUKA|nr:E3 ubiquitin-protein ligase ZSWIM2 [Carpediemonas membranifera]|eukprot:KAG9397348.1 E3 ubiquitin-protein ligase ZSWIM2 [Carpediemonas membranifera]